MTVILKLVLMKVRLRS